MKIKASSELVKSASLINERFNEIYKSIDTIQNYIEQTNKVWKGTDADSFTKKYNEEVIPNLRKFKSSMEKYVTFLSKVYPVYKALDEYYDKPIN